MQTAGLQLEHNATAVGRWCSCVPMRVFCFLPVFLTAIADLQSAHQLMLRIIML